MIRILSQHSKYLILFSVVIAIFFGITIPFVFEPVQFLGHLFINLLKLFALPLISSALIAALGNLSGSLSSVKTLSKKLVAYMVLSEVMAVSIALFCLTY